MPFSLLSRFPSLTEHVSSKSPFPVNCLRSLIYTSQYLARLLLPCQFSLPSFILPVNCFLVLANHLTSLSHFVFYFWTPSPFQRLFRFNILIYSTLVSCKLHCTQYSFTNAHLCTVHLKMMLFFICRFVLKEGSKLLLCHHYEMETKVDLWPCCPFHAGTFEHFLMFHLMDPAFKSPLSCSPEI